MLFTELRIGRACDRAFLKFTEINSEFSNEGGSDRFQHQHETDCFSSLEAVHRSLAELSNATPALQHFLALFMETIAPRSLRSCDQHFVILIPCFTCHKKPSITQNAGRVPQFSYRPFYDADGIVAIFS
jgi:hypothetical protein